MSAQCGMLVSPLGGLLVCLSKVRLVLCCDVKLFIHILHSKLHIVMHDIQYTAANKTYVHNAQ